MNNDVNTREKGLEIMVEGFIKSGFNKMMLELLPKEAEKIQEKYSNDINVDMNGNHPEFRTSMYCIKKRS